jgi:hypothetical protein
MSPRMQECPIPDPETLGFKIFPGPQNPPERLKFLSTECGFKILFKRSWLQDVIHPIVLEAKIKYFLLDTWL